MLPKHSPQGKSRNLINFRSGAASGAQSVPLISNREVDGSMRRWFGLAAVAFLPVSAIVSRDLVEMGFTIRQSLRG
ncbi:hypothetical protein QA641_40020 [Bradyrhizobium sp. CB1650]|uniref:hypothetical protein n=1 Tax=Bradyrhizobium sp. CB1650 TaxID=3039153 RepID=UPI0024348C21|nr:hypothetical protein [Bradyrhizobium sp. CB1650]WGD51558.1 hypothetical protein QA641_40020 [Bradyrhizobium sp. CB1650]